MSGDDLTQRFMEQIGPIIEKLLRRVETPLTDRDKLAVGLALNESALMGARIVRAWIVANAAEAGLDVSTVDMSGFEFEDAWPFPE